MQARYSEVCNVLLEGYGGSKVDAETGGVIHRNTGYGRANVDLNRRQLDDNCLPHEESSRII